MSLISQLASSIFGSASPDQQAGAAGAAGAAAGAAPASAATGQSALLAGVMGLINHPQVGGLSGLMQKFESAGLGHLMQGWVSTGPNPPVTGDQLQTALGSERIAEVAQKLGLSQSDVMAHLSALLPQVVDKLTPGGKLPQQA